MDALHKQLRHMKRLKVVLRQPLKRTKHVTVQDSSTISVKCIHCQVETYDVETQASGRINQETSSGRQVEKSDTGTQVFEMSFRDTPSTDASVQVNITPTRIPRLIGTKFNFYSECSPPSLRNTHAACQTEESPRPTEVFVKAFSNTPRPLYRNAGNAPVQSEIVNLKLEEKLDVSLNCKRNGTIYNGSCQRHDVSSIKDLKYDLDLEEISDLGAEDLTEQVINKTEDLNFSDLSPRVRRGSSLGILSKKRNSISTSGIPVFNGWYRKTSTCDVHERHQCSTERNSDSARTDLSATSTDDIEALQHVDYGPTTPLSEDLDELTKQIAERASCGKSEAGGDAGTRGASKLPSLLSQRSLRAPTCYSPRKISPRVRSVLSLQ